MDDPNRQVQMVNTRGRVIWVPLTKVPEIRLEGGLVVRGFTKETYLPQYDQTLTMSSVSTTADTNEDISVPDDVLDVRRM